MKRLAALAVLIASGITLAEDDWTNPLDQLPAVGEQVEALVEWQLPLGAFSPTWTEVLPCTRDANVWGCLRTDGLERGRVVGWQRWL